MADSDVGKNKQPQSQLSRRDFLKLGWIVAGGSVLAGLGLKIEYGNDPVSMGSRVMRDVLNAEFSGDENQVKISRKTAVTYLFAQSAVEYAKRNGYEASSWLMNHYLYGDGVGVDASNLLTEISSDSGFLERIFRRSFAEFSNEYKKNKLIQLPHDRLKKIVKFYQEKLKTGVSFSMDTDTEGSNSDLYYALGSSTFTVKSGNSTFEIEENGDVVADVRDIDLSIYDTYDWLGIENTHTSGFIETSAKNLTYETIENFFGSEDEVEALIDHLNFSPTQKEIMLEIYNEAKNEFSITVGRRAFETSDKFSKSITGDEDGLVMNFNLLERVGAKVYEITGNVKVPRNISLKIN